MRFRGIRGTANELLGSLRAATAIGVALGNLQRELGPHGADKLPPVRSEIQTFLWNEGAIDLPKSPMPDGILSSLVQS